MDTVLVTGGAGFIGSNLIDKLLGIGNKVICMDNLNNYYNPCIKERNILDVKKNMNRSGIYYNNLIICREDIRNREAVERIFKENKIDLVIHLAAMAGVRTSILEPVLYYEVNINGTLNLLDCCRNYRVRNFVFASSSSVYGNNEKVPFSEDDMVDNPISPYAATKKSGELLCHTYYHLYDIKTVCLRFFTVYGPRQRPDLAIHKFMNLIMEDKPVPLYGDGTTERDYTYIDDIVDGIIKAIEFLKSSSKIYEIFNLGESQTISLNKMVQTIEEVLDKKAKLNRLPIQAGDVKRTFADITKARTVLGYSPKMEFKYGIKAFYEWLAAR